MLESLKLNESQQKDLRDLHIAYRIAVSYGETQFAKNLLSEITQIEFSQQFAAWLYDFNAGVLKADKFCFNIIDYFNREF